MPRESADPRLAPVDLRRAVVGDAGGVPALALGRDARAEALPVACGVRRPGDLRDRAEAREQHGLQLLERGDRLGPERRLYAEDRVLAHAVDDRGRIPLVAVAQLDVAGPV